MMKDIYESTTCNDSIIAEFMTAYDQNYISLLIVFHCSEDLSAHGIHPGVVSRENTS